VAAPQKIPNDMRLQFLIPAFLFFACQPQQLKNESPAVNQVKVSVKFMIVLPENHKNGELWTLAQDYNKQTVCQLSEVWHGNEKGIYFNLKAQAVGQTTLNFFKRKFSDTIDNKHFTIKVSPSQ
jgi:hypothetical protein